MSLIECIEGNTLFLYIAGMPPHLRSICLRFGGRFFNNKEGRGVYVGGWTRWIHYVNPLNFKLAELFQATHRVLHKLGMYRESNWMGLVWYFRQGGSTNHDLRVIQNEDGLRDMWIDADRADATEVYVFMQDVEVEACHRHRTLLYAIPMKFQLRRVVSTAQR